MNTVATIADFWFGGMGQGVAVAARYGKNFAKLA
jgi:hypothetical protein